MALDETRKNTSTQFKSTWPRNPLDSVTYVDPSDPVTQVALTYIIQVNQNQSILVLLQITAFLSLVQISQKFFIDSKC